MISLVLDRVLLNLSSNGILALFVVIGFEVNNGSLLISDILLNSSLRKFSLQPGLIKDSFNSSKCL